MVEKLDSVDKRLLVELDIDSRSSASQIGKKLKISKNTVNYRINRMIKLNIIQGYYAVIDTVKLGYYNFRIYFRIRATNKQKEEFISELVNERRIWWVARISSPWDVAIILLAKNLHEAKQIANKVIDKHSDIIQQYHFVSYVELRHFPKTYLAETEIRPSFTLGTEKTIEVNELETKILRELSKDARIGTVSLAKKLGSTPMIVKYAIKKLIKSKVILGFRILVDYDKIGYEYYWVHLNVSSKRKAISAFVQSLPNTVYFDETIGGWNIDFALHIAKDDKIENWMNKINEKFGDSITEHHSLRVIKNEKVSYMPQE
jgi:DNA-binding Lrp family transcriptional regulator